MYCKHCGKEIADDSKFCQHCGGKQLESEVKDNEAPFGRIVSKLFPNINNKYFYIYVVWVVLNLIFLCYGRSNALVKFFPFTHFDGWENRDTPYFNLDYYDSTEFITYVILIPLLVLYYFKYWHEPLKRKINEMRTKKR